jgi:hypothetical protein
MSFVPARYRPVFGAFRNAKAGNTADPSTKPIGAVKVPSPERDRLSVSAAFISASVVFAHVAVMVVPVTTSASGNV